jgi:peptide-methionine (S)-S-oxide reductase
MFGAGCFWGVEAVFRQIKGVTATQVGFSGGLTANPSYKDVCAGDTAHAEVVWVEYDPAVVAYGDLLKAFWENHDPTQVNRQGPDVGDQYRSVIFYFTEDQGAQAAESKRQRQAALGDGRVIATVIAKAGPFYRAEDYHQRYLEKRGLFKCK